MSGKSSALQRLATEVWVHKDGKSCFGRNYVFSASVGKTFDDGIDDTWLPVKRLIDSQLIDRTNPNHNAEQFFYDDLDATAMQALSDIVDMQFRMIELSRKHGRKKEPQILIFLDDVSDQPRWTKSPILTKLYTRGRHANLTTVSSVHRRKRGQQLNSEKPIDWHPLLSPEVSPRVASIPGRKWGHLAGS